MQSRSEKPPTPQATSGLPSSLTKAKRGPNGGPFPPFKLDERQSSLPVNRQMRGIREAICQMSASTALQLLRAQIKHDAGVLMRRLDGLAISD